MMSKGKFGEGLGNKIAITKERWSKEKWVGSVSVLGETIHG